ncbi:uncharacterized protein LY89DRAFT_729341 [Mollisia scopiformis]|uniref:Uncharacterized protein n=1 Tax=Mollisia scopiformis TaxID=149040 RepID=A0A194XNL3_MOLSC|nr:uncharacterized protein LY89DRAFT_729341 [Mollisia scopiformis]KUJ21840.1 hypothetical protein LY89DRAFT_729341 [Mollisia scopiformis]
MRNVAGLLVLWFCLGLSFVHGNDTLWFNADAGITKFQVTMIVPSISRGLGSHGVWPGLQNDDDTFVFQSVVSDSRVPGTWQFFVEYCCNPDYQATSVRVYPGDSITSTFSVGANAQWTDTWSISPGAAGRAAGATAQSGSSGNSFSNRGTIDKAVLSIELQNSGVWDFGQVQWSSLSITASTTQSWCNGAYVASSSFKYAVSGGASHTSGSSTTCVYNSVTFG